MKSLYFFEIEGKKMNHSNTPYSKTTCKTIRKFYDDFDLLPSHIKEMLYNGNSCPTQEDIRAAWELVESETKGGLGSIYNILHVFEEDRKQKEIEEARRKREQARQEKYNKKYNRHRNRFVEVMTLVNPRNRNDKHGNLVRKVVSEQQLEEMLAKRKQNDYVKNASPYWVRSFKKIEEVEKDSEIKYMENEPQVSIFKAMHNAGGKK